MLQKKHQRLEALATNGALRGVPAERVANNEV